MTIEIRPARLSDVGRLADLLLMDAKMRFASDPLLWALNEHPHERLVSMLKSVMQAEAPPMRQTWLVAETGGDIIGASHSILLPVPPIYAGPFGPPGLIMEDSCVAPTAPDGTCKRLIDAAEADLTEAGAQILLGSSVEGGSWAAQYLRHSYTPLTRYLAKTGLGEVEMSETVRKAHSDDVPAIVTASAVHRQILFDLHNTFWEPHKEADSRFGSWMQRSLTLPDRDMFVAETTERLQGYAISQPATPLHFPVPHDISRVGVIDDFHHAALAAPDRLGAGAAQATALLEAGGAARAARGGNAVLVVCPAAWASKIRILTDAGYSPAITWYFKKAGGAPQAGMASRMI